MSTAATAELEALALKAQASFEARVAGATERRGAPSSALERQAALVALVRAGARELAPFAAGDDGVPLLKSPPSVPPRSPFPSYTRTLPPRSIGKQFGKLAVDPTAVESGRLATLGAYSVGFSPFDAIRLSAKDLEAIELQARKMQQFLLAILLFTACLATMNIVLPFIFEGDSFFFEGDSDIPTEESQRRLDTLDALTQELLACRNSSRLPFLRGRGPNGNSDYVLEGGVHDGTPLSLRNVSDALVTLPRPPGNCSNAFQRPECFPINSSIASLISTSPADNVCFVLGRYAQSLYESVVCPISAELEALVSAPVYYTSMYGLPLQVALIVGLFASFFLIIVFRPKGRREWALETDQAPLIISRLFSAHRAPEFMISYRWTPTTTAIAENLAGLLPNTWLDRQQLHVGERIIAECIAISCHARMLIILLSDTYLNSNNCCAELCAAVRFRDENLPTFVLLDHDNVSVRAALTAVNGFVVVSSLPELIRELDRHALRASSPASMQRLLRWWRAYGQPHRTFANGANDDSVLFAIRHLGRSGLAASGSRWTPSHITRSTPWACVARMCASTCMLATTLSRTMDNFFAQITELPPTPPLAC